MKCENCDINEIEVEELVDDGQNPYRLCKSCHQKKAQKTPKNEIELAQKIKKEYFNEKEKK